MKQIMRFAAVGIGSGTINFLVYNAFLLGFHFLHIFAGYDYLLALIAGFLLSVLWSFGMSRKYVFNSHGEQEVWYKALLKMYVVYAFTGVVLSSLLSVLWVEVLEIPKQIVSILNDITCFPLTFLLNKFWSFKKAKADT